MAALVAALLPASFLHPAASAEPFQLLVSRTADRTAPVELQGTTQSGSIFVFTSPSAGVSQVRFYLDDPGMTGAPRSVERGAPHDFAGTASNGNAKPFKTGNITTGSHTITAALDLTGGGTTVLSGTFTVTRPTSQPDLTLNRSSLTLEAPPGGAPQRASVALGTSNGATTAYSAATSASWLTVEATSPTAPSAVDVVATPGSLPAGTHTGSVTFSATGYDPVTMSVVFIVGQTGGASHELVVSTNKYRSEPLPLEGRTLSGNRYIFLASTSGATSTSWWLDDPTRAGSPWYTDAAAPFDFMTGSTVSAAKPFNTASVPDGTHSITAVVTTDSGETVVRTATFTTSNNTNSLSWSPVNRTINVDPASPSPVTFEAQLGATRAGTVATIVDDAPLVTASRAQATTPDSVGITVDPASLPEGVYRFTVQATASGAFPATIDITVNVGDSQGCEPLACDQYKVQQPYVLSFDEDQGGLPDSDGTGTGFRMLLPARAGTGYVRKAVTLSTSRSTLAIKGSPDAFKGTENGQENALGVGFNGGVMNAISTTLTNIPALSGKYEQAGLWFGFDQDHVDKLNLVSKSDGLHVEHALEVNGQEVSRKQGGAFTVSPTDTVKLSLTADPLNRKLTASYRVGSGPWTPVGSFAAPGEFFSADAAGIDPRVGTRSFAGLFASQRQATQPPVFEFADFAVTSQPVTASDELDFQKKSHRVGMPTSLAFGPDGRLYVLLMDGRIKALTYDADYDVVAEQTITTLGSRLALGLTVDPASTAQNVILWTAHSSPSLDQGEADSGTITRLSGPGLATRQDVITGLPRSIANHGPNSLHFGPDGRLFMAIGGNTGAGSANNGGSEFGDRGEQPLSAALLVANVKGAGFDGTCADPTDIYSSDNCDVQVFASGLRNTYDFTFHSNGHIYGPDNGLGVLGTYPPTSSPPCRGMGDTRSYLNGGNNPGDQPDDLNLIEEGRYYGHPNPTRGECVFGDGSYQSVPALPNHTPAMYDLGRSRSANGIIEYQDDAFCGSLTNDLLLTNYSVGDDIIAVRLSADGRSVRSVRSLVTGLADPLPLVEAPDGTLIVGEFGGGSVTALMPTDMGCWRDEPAPPVGLLDAGGTAIGNQVYVVGGKTSSGPKSAVHVYDTSTNSWSSAPPLPGPAVENPATVAAGGKLYVFGGSTDPFSGAVGRSAVLDPATGTWTLLPNLPTPRGGAVAQHIDGKIYVAGGMTADGASSARVEVFNISSGTWTTAASMSTARDNPGSAVLNGSLVVFGGRTRLASGALVNGALTSVEALNPASGTWSARAPMPTGRRTMVSAVVNGKALLMGGEGAPDGSSFSANESYDPATDSWRRLLPMPTPRHGAAAGTVGQDVHVIGGGPTGGSSWTTAHEVFTPPA